MGIITLDFPPGLYKNGTPYSRRKRWTDGNLVRWHDGAWRPIGGWTRRQTAGADIAAIVATPANEAYRDIFAWRDLSNSQNTAFGSNLAVKHMNAAGTITDITPGTYAPSNPSKDASVQAGFGQNPYGIGAYGSANNLVGTDPIPPNRWAFANFGEILLYVSRSNGSLYEVSPSALGAITVVTNSPSNLQDICVTDERQVFAIGGNGEPRRVQATDTEDRTDWTPAVSNQSIDRVLAGSGRLLRCIPVLNQILLLGETDASAGRYVGPPYIYSIDEVGENCGLIAAEAVAKTDRFAVWWGERNFWLYDGTVQVLDCDVIDYLYDDMEPNQVSKIVAFSNTDFSEIWWLYQSLSSTTTEVDSYVVWNYRTRRWYTGRLDRTAAVDKGVLLFPIMVSSVGEIYNHELDDVLPLGEGDVFIASGVLEMANGHRNLACRYIWPDTESLGDVSFTLLGAEFPNTVEYTYGPYAYNNPVPTTGAQGRQLRLRADFLSADAEMGINRLEVSPLGGGMR